ncbi:DUF418 domain-containing protein [Pseudogracilibacillus sp. SE30717A]|uniref:DUF418 domain-containing protein n=1 Tax=Pseudogracilibacillus sp. SE30717A TaxID=3098293 RepID=UPI00300E6CDD
MRELDTIQEKDRLFHIDVIRGIAIFGILLVNMAHFSYPDLYLHMIGPDNFFTQNWSMIDNITVNILNIFVQMKFITMFSFLFGFGMVIMWERAKEKDQKFGPIIFRRLIALLFFGTIHAFFIWDGDILTDYALLGLVLLFFIKRRPKTILIWAISLYFLFAIPLVLATAVPTEESGEMAEWQAEMKLESKQNADQAIQTYSEGSFLEISKQRIHDRMYYMSMNGMLTLNPILYLFSTIPYFSMFLLGAYFAKRKLLHHPKKFNASLKRLWAISLLIGLPTNILFGIFDNDVFLLIGAPFLMMFYVISIVFIIKFSWAQKILVPFAAVGRNAFTNYVLQSIIATTIFYNYGLGLYGKVNPFMGLFISFAIFFIQLIISNIWIKYFRYGPLEWVWRVVTYKKVSPFRY